MATEDSGSGRLVVAGELTIAQVAALRERLLEAFAKTGELTVDLSGAGHFDVAGLQLLCSAHRYAAACGKSLALDGTGEGFTTLLRAVGVTSPAFCGGRALPRLQDGGGMKNAQQAD